VRSQEKKTTSQRPVVFYLHHRVFTMAHLTFSMMALNPIDASGTLSTINHFIFSSFRQHAGFGVVVVSISDENRIFIGKRTDNMQEPGMLPDLIGENHEPSLRAIGRTGQETCPCLVAFA
jgi:hypothetical protein